MFDPSRVFMQTSRSEQESFQNGQRYQVERRRALHGWGVREKNGGNLPEKQIPNLGHWDLLFRRPSLCFTLRFYETPQCTYDKACVFSAVLSWVSSSLSPKESAQYGYPFLTKAMLGFGGGGNVILVLKYDTV